MIEEYTLSREVKTDEISRPLNLQLPYSTSGIIQLKTLASIFALQFILEATNKSHKFLSSLLKLVLCHHGDGIEKNIPFSGRTCDVFVITRGRMVAV